MTDAQTALAQVREALADEALFDDGASACDTLLAVRHFERVCTLDNIAAILAHVEAQKAEIERLTASLKRANETAEHFERHWYLRGDEIERLTAECADLRRQLDECSQMLARQAATIRELTRPAEES